MLGLRFYFNEAGAVIDADRIDQAYERMLPATIDASTVGD